MSAKELQSIFSFVHISDLHFQSENTKEEVFRSEILRKMRELQINPNCLIISGDIFHKGFLTADSADKTIQFIKNLKNPDTPCFAVPGNHDLNRFACQKSDDAYNFYLTRREIVRKKVNDLLNDPWEFSLEEAEKEVLYSKAFDDFFKFLSKAGFSPFGKNSQDSDKQLECTASNYEVGVQCVGLPKLNSCVRIVLINTALIAGQSVIGSEYHNFLNKIRKGVFNELDLGHNEEASKQVDTFLRKQAQFREAGELIIDEEPLPNQAGGRMSLSKEGLKALSNIGVGEDNHNCVLTIFVGHHEIDYLSNETKEALFTAMARCNSHIYLCGHAHKAGHTIQVQHGTQIVNQFRSGGLFLDKRKYGQCSFNYGELLIRGTQDVHSEDREVKTRVELILRINTYFQIETPSSDLVWHCEEYKKEISPVEIYQANKARDELSKKDTSDPKPIENTSARPAETGNVFKKNQRSVV